MGGFDKARLLAGVVQDPADFRDGDFQYIGADVDIGPNAVEQFLLAYQLAGSFGEIAEDAKGLRREVERFGTAGKTPCRQIELERGKGDTLAGGC